MKTVARWYDLSAAYTNVIMFFALFYGVLAWFFIVRKGK